FPFPFSFSSNNPIDSMTKLLIKLFIVSLIGQICFACFKEAPVSTARKVLKITDPSPSAAECEKVCTADANCKAYAYYGTTCGMFGDVVEENKVFVRGTDC
ncbi:hypothetical protein PFISCL1PPCAC_21529, partial [Pristionchus fissidentatus]